MIRWPPTLTRDEERLSRLCVRRQAGREAATAVDGPSVHSGGVGCGQVNRPRPESFELTKRRL